VTLALPAGASPRTSPNAASRGAEAPPSSGRVRERSDFPQPTHAPDEAASPRVAGDSRDASKRAGGYSITAAPATMESRGDVVHAERDEDRYV